jgi:small subunit ribosomal protein S10
MSQKLKIVLISCDSRLLRSAEEKIISALCSTSAKIIGPIPLPTKRKIFTILRSPHVNKEARDQFIYKSCKSLIVICNLDSKIVEILMGVPLPKGVEVKTYAY